MEHLFNFGISQEDALTEYKALDLQTGDRLLCIASAGEIPLNLLALQDIQIEAVDTSISQLYLSKIKLHAIRSLEPLEAAAFLGFMDATTTKRKQFFEVVSRLMDDREKQFWQINMFAIEEGPIRVARFEKYIAKFSLIGLMIIGKKKLFRLFELDTVDEQREFFDRYLSTLTLKTIFKIAFHPKIYKKRGMASQALTHSGERNIASFFYSRFRDFCSSTIARKNYYFQFSFFNQVLFPEALPEYLTEEGIKRIRQNFKKIVWKHVSYLEALQQCKSGAFNKFHLSNIGDWMSKGEYADHLRLIQAKTNSSGKILARYIHLNHEIPFELQNWLKRDDQLGEELTKQDRYPFYSLVPMEFK